MPDPISCAPARRGRVVLHRMAWCALACACAAPAAAQIVPVDDVTAVAASFGNLYVRRSDGTLKAAGRSDYGQIGDGMQVDRRTAVDVAALGTGVLAVAGGGFHACAIVTGGSVECWGLNGAGNLGDGSNTNRYVPTQVPAIASGATMLALGGSHSCALVNGGAQCWGLNDAGQLGNNSLVNSNVPVAVSGLGSGVTAVAAGGSGDFTCALVSGGVVKCWGDNLAGNLGDGSFVSRRVPTDVVDIGAGVQAIAVGGDHACAINSAGGLECWGFNAFGQLGNASTTNSPRPMDVVGLGSGVVAVGLGLQHSCAVTGAGALYCWGANSRGETGGGAPSHSTPVLVGGLAAGVQRVAAGSEFTCALLQGGRVQCFGGNATGQLGNNSTVDSTVPVFFSSNGGADTRVTTLVPAADAASIAPDSDASGRYVVFQSSASNLAGGGADSNGSDDVFRVDTRTGARQRVSVTNAGGQILGDSIEPTISADGSFVAFVAPDAAVTALLGESKSARAARIKAGGYGVFLRNLLTSTTQRIGSGLAGGIGTRPQFAPGGSAVVYTGTNTDPVQGANGQDNVYHVPLGRTGNALQPQSPACVSCKSRSAMGVPVADSNGPSRDAVVSADGRYVAYETAAKNSLAAQPSPCPGASAEVILRDLLTGTSQRISPPPALPAINCGVSGSTNPSIDYSGLNIAFESDQPLKPGDANAGVDVYQVGPDTFGFARASERADGSDANGPSTQPAMAGDGRSVVFVSQATDLDPAAFDSNGRADLHGRRRGGGVERLALAANGAQADGAANRPALNYNATLIAFDSAATNLVAGDTNGQADVFQRAFPANALGVFGTGFE